MIIFSPFITLKKVSNLKFALVIIFIICLCVIVNGFIEQDKISVFYQQNYPFQSSFFSLTVGELILVLGLDHIYTTYLFLVLCFLLSISLISCSLSVQIPIVESIRRCQFYSELQEDESNHNILDHHTSNLCIFQYHKLKYNLFRQRKKIYGYIGLTGRFGPIIVHISLVLLIIGVCFSLFKGYDVQASVFRGEIFRFQNQDKFRTSSILVQSNIVWRLNDFWLTYTKDSVLKQFYSDLIVLDSMGNELERKVIFTNEPFLYKYLSLHQSEWHAEGLKLKQNNISSIQVSLKKVVRQELPENWVGYIIPSENGLSSKTLEVRVDNLDSSVYFYDEVGRLIQKLNLGQVLFLKKQSRIKSIEFLLSAGLECTNDPGIQVVYFALFLLLVGNYLSFSGYSQLWLVEHLQTLILVGNSNRTSSLFKLETSKLSSSFFIV